jgi:AcrR family transcriptional regulator
VSPHSNRVQAVKTIATGRAKPMAPQDRRAAILTAALPLVRQHGRAVTTRQIAVAAGIAEGTIFRVFPDKEALILAVADRALSSDGVLAGLRAIDPALPLQDRLVKIVDVLSERLTAVFELMSALGMDRPPPTPGTDASAEARKHHDLRLERQQQMMIEVTTLLTPDASHLRYPPERTAQLIRLFTFAARHPTITGENVLPSEQIADVLLHGVVSDPQNCNA